MKKFIFNIFIFSIVLIVLCFAIGNVKITDEYICYKTKNTSYEKIAWNLNLINNHPEKINGSILFFGPSLTQAGICDSTFQANKINAINFGTNGAGNEVELFFLEKAIKYKPKKIFLHIYKGEHKDLHNMTPLLYTSVGLLQAGQNVNFNYLSFLFKRASYVLDYFVWELFIENFQVESYSSFGSRGESASVSDEFYAGIEKETMLDFFESVNLSKNEFRKSTELNRKGFYFNLIKFRRSVIYFLNNFEFVNNIESQNNFDRTAFELSKLRNIEINHLYIPVIADVKIDKDFNELFYNTYDGKPVSSLKNFKFMDSCVYWADMTHLSKKGGIAFTNECIIQGIIQP